MNADNKKFGEIAHFIYKNIDQPIKLDDIAAKAGMSLASLKRFFHEMVNQSPGAFIRRLRMESAFHTLQNQENSILEVALSAGFDDQSAFSRRFKQIFGYSPKYAKEKINIIKELECIQLEAPQYVKIKDATLQAVTETGLYFESAPKAWGNLQKKLTNVELSDDFSGTFIGIGHDNPHEGIVPENQVRFSACLSHLNRDLNIEKITIKGGEYAKFSYTGKPNNLGLAYHYIFGQWADTSKSKIDTNKPTFCIFEKFPNAAKEEKIMIYVPAELKHFSK